MSPYVLVLLMMASSGSAAVTIDMPDRETCLNARRTTASSEMVGFLGKGVVSAFCVSRERGQ